MWYVYLLVCKNSLYYIGATNNIEKRMKAHRSGKGSKFVRANLPFTLYSIIDCKNKSDALKLEYRLKKLNRKIKLIYFIKHCRYLYAQNILTKKKDVDNE